MIIDAHQHVVASAQLGNYQASLFHSRGSQDRSHHRISPESIANARWQGHKHSEVLDEVGTDLAFISPRPYTMMNSEKPEIMVHWYAAAVNDVIKMAVDNEPDRFRGIAGLPQCSGTSPTNTFEEIDRSINDLGFIGVMVNPDPGEGDYATPAMGEEYWYPLYEKLEAMDVPILLHPGSCKNTREPFHNHFITEESIAILSIAKSTVFEDFPKLKMVISHGGGSVPYQVGRWRSQMRGPNDTETFDERLKMFYFDTGLYNKESLELLFKIVGPDRCLFGTERPGAGSKMDPRSGRWYDDLKPVIEEIDFLTAEDREGIFQKNAEAVYTRLAVKATTAP